MDKTPEQRQAEVDALTARAIDPADEYTGQHEDGRGGDDE